MSDLNAKLTEWHFVSNELAKYKERELQLRNEIFGEAFPNPVKGTNRVSIGHGKDLKATYRMNYRIDQPLMLAARDSIPVELFNEVIKFRPEVSQTVWHKLAPEQLRPFTEFVTETPGTPALEIVDSKGRK